MPRLRYTLLPLLLAVTLAACDSEGSSLYDPDLQRNPAPVVASVSPTGVVLAGVDPITIEGQNFSDDPADIIVYFDDSQGNAAQGEVLEASATRLVVRTPNLPNPALRIRVAVVGAQDFSNGVPFPLTAAVVPFGDIGQTEEPFAIASGDDGALYVSLFNEGSSVGIKRIAPDGTRSDYFASAFPWADLTFSNGSLYGVRRIRALFELPEGGSQGVVGAFQPSSLSLQGVTAGPDGVLYTGGNGGVIFRVETDGTATTFPFTPTVRDLVVLGGALYVTGQEGTQSRVWRLPIDGATLGAPTAVADIEGTSVAIAAAADGTLFVATSAVADPIVLVNPDGSTEPLYPGVLTGPATGLAWADGTGLYMVRGATADARPNILRIETRRQRGS